MGALTGMASNISSFVMDDTTLYYSGLHNIYKLAK